MSQRNVSESVSVKRRRISSLSTAPLKWGFPLVWSSGWGYGTIELLLHPDKVAFNGVVGGAPPDAGVWALLLWIVGTTFAAAFAWGFKRVRVDREFLYVSNYLREVKVPLREVADVYHPTMSRAVAVTVELERSTPFGRRIRFMARGRRSRATGNFRGMDDLIGAIHDANHGVPAGTHLEPALFTRDDSIGANRRPRPSIVEQQPSDR